MGAAVHQDDKPSQLLPLVESHGQQYLDKRGVYLHRKNRQAVRAFAEDLIADSFSSVDFTVQVCTVIDDLLGDFTI